MKSRKLITSYLLKYIQIKTRLLKHQRLLKNLVQHINAYMMKYLVEIMTWNFVTSKNRQDSKNLGTEMNNKKNKSLNLVNPKVNKRINSLDQINLKANKRNRKEKAILILMIAIMRISMKTISILMIFTTPFSNSFRMNSTSTPILETAAVQVEIAVLDIATALMITIREIMN